MKCKQLRILYPDYVSMRSSPTEIALVEDHLSGCRSCSIDVQEMSKLDAHLKAVPITPPSEVYWTTLATKIHQRRERAQSGSVPEWILRFILPSAAATLLVLLVLTTGLQIGSGSGKNLLAVVSTLSNEELQQVTDQTMWNSDFLSSSSAVPNSEFSEDVAVLIQLVSDENQGAFYSELDIDDVVSTLDEQEVAQLVSSLQQRNLEY